MDKPYHIFSFFMHFSHYESTNVHLIIQCVRAAGSSKKQLNDTDKLKDIFNLNFVEKEKISKNLT